MSVLPIVTYNDSVLREKAKPVENSERIQRLIDDMFETMYNAHGVGLAAPQIGVSLRLFVVDADVMAEDDKDAVLYGPMVFINPVLHAVESNEVEMEEGCLSIPDLREKIIRPDKIRVTFLDKDFKNKEMKFSDWMARVVQHEFDHINGVLFIDYVGSFRKRLMRTKLDMIESGTINTEYPLATKTNRDK
ncbi:MAG: peptide deformylase [Balneolales bacterium]